MKQKYLDFLQYVLDRLQEASTWSAVGFIVSLFTAKFAGLDWGQCAALGSLMSAAIKALLPDDISKVLK